MKKEILLDGKLKNARGYIYVLSNPLYQNIYKIGKANDIDKRMQDLSRHSGILKPFKCEYKKLTDNTFHAELLLHTAFSNQRIDVMREFFNVDKKVALKGIDKVIEMLDKEPYYFEKIFPNYSNEWSESEVLDLVNEYKKNPNFMKLAKKFGRTPYELEVILNSVGFIKTTSFPKAIPNFKGFRKDYMKNGILHFK